MPPPSLLCAFCCCFLAAATRAGFSEDRCSWRGRPHCISRRVASFCFELRGDPRPELPPRASLLGEDGWSWRPLWEATGVTPSVWVCQSLHKDTELQVGACRPCSSAEFLLAFCTSDFMIHGTILGVAHDTELQESVITVAAARVLRQTLPLFQVEGPGIQVQASIRTPLHCGVRPGPGTFLFMGWSHFSEAWLGYAPCIQEFSHACAAAQANHLYPCEVALD